MNNDKSNLSIVSQNYNRKEQENDEKSSRRYKKNHANWCKGRTMEVATTKVNLARQYGEKIMKDNGRELDKEIPFFDKNYIFAQKQAKQGFAKEKRCLLLIIKT